VKVSDKRVFVALMALLISTSACFKKDIKVTLPAKTGSSVLQVKMGSTYENCYFINLEKASVVMQSNIGAWHLRFDATAAGSAVLMNSGNHSMRIIRSNTDNIKGSIKVPGLDTTWGYDSPTSLIDSAYLNNWLDANGKAKDEVYIVRIGDGVVPLHYYKIKMMSVNADNYVMQYDTINGITPKTILIPKQMDKNFVYFSFEDGGKVVEWEPAKTSWDICFMPYHEPFYFAKPFLYYPVTGCLANSYKTLCTGDTTTVTNFSTFTLQDAAKYQLLPYANGIGYNWKKPDNNFSFITHPEYIYLVKNQLGHLYKLHFLDFYFQGLEKGAPKFEWERLE
jgi:hypothetical protein